MTIELRAKPLKYKEAEGLIERVNDPVLANMMRYALAQAHLHLLPSVDLDRTEWEKSLPIEPFDLEFFLRIVHSMFYKREIVRQLMAGATLASATGWDAFD
jgi:hypothetical protein